MRAIFLFLAALAALGVSVTHAQITPYPVVLTTTGPATAVSGQEITYTVNYQLTDPATISGTDIVIRITQGATYVSTQVTSGPAGLLAEQTERRVRWSGLGSPEETEGEVELTVRIDPDYTGSIFGSAYVPGTETTESNVVETQVSAPGTLPETGGGPAASVSGQENACGRPREPGELAILGRTTPAVDQGTVRIPELDLTSEIMAGCFEFRNLTLPQDPMLVSFEIRVEGYRPATWANYIVLSTGSAPNFTPRLEPGDKPELIDPCPALLATPQKELSAAQYQQAQLCAQLPNSGMLPEAGGGGPVAGSGPLVVPALLAVVGAALICAGAAARRMRRAR